MSYEDEQMASCGVNDPGWPVSEECSEDEHERCQDRHCACECHSEPELDEYHRWVDDQLTSV